MYDQISQKNKKHFSFQETEDFLPKNRIRIYTTKIVNKQYEKKQQIKIAFAQFIL